MGKPQKKLQRDNREQTATHSKETDFDEAVERVRSNYGSDVSRFLRDVQHAIVLKRQSDK